MVGYLLETWIAGMGSMAKSLKYRTTTSRFRLFHPKCHQFIMSIDSFAVRFVLYIASFRGYRKVMITSGQKMKLHMFKICDARFQSQWVYQAILSRFLNSICRFKKLSFFGLPIAIHRSLHFYDFLLYLKFQDVTNQLWISSTAGQLFRDLFQIDRALNIVLVRFIKGA